MAYFFGLLAIVAALSTVMHTVTRAVPLMNPFLMPQVSAYMPYYNPQQRRLVVRGSLMVPTGGGSGTGGNVFAQGAAVGGGAYLDRPLQLRPGPEPVEEQPLELPARDHPLQKDGPLNDSGPVDEGQAMPLRPVQEPPMIKDTPAPLDPEDEASSEGGCDDDYDFGSFFPTSKGDKRKYHPGINTFFPVVFNLPRSSGRRGSMSGSGSSHPGPVTAIANSYSTSKGGVASSIATAYGGMPTKKQKYDSLSR